MNKKMMRVVSIIVVVLVTISMVGYLLLPLLYKF